MKFLLDTNILIYLIKNRPPSIAARINALGEEATLCMSFFTFGELLKGAERSTRKPEVLRRLDQLTLQIPVLYTEVVCRIRHPEIGSNRAFICVHL